VYIWLQLFQIVTDFNNFCSAKTGKTCEAGRAFTYLLLKESVADDVINVIVCLRQNCVKIFNKRRQNIAKNVWESKKYEVKGLVRELPNKNWSKRGVQDFQKRLRTTWYIERAPDSGHPRTTQTAENVDTVGDLVQNQENQPRYTAPLDRSHESSEYLKQITGDDFFCSLFLWT